VWAKADAPTRRGCLATARLSPLARASALLKHGLHAGVIRQNAWEGGLGLVAVLP